MRRLLVVLIAVTVLLLFSSSYLIAGSPTSISRPYIVTPKDATTLLPGIGNPAKVEGGGEDEDRGDADDLAGAKGKSTFTGSSIGDPHSKFEARLAARFWWMYMFVHRVF